MSLISSVSLLIMNAEHERIVAYWLPFFEDAFDSKYLTTLAALYRLKCFATPEPELVLRDLITTGRLRMETEADDGGMKAIVTKLGTPGLYELTPMETKRRVQNAPRLQKEAERAREERQKREEQERELAYYQQLKREEEERAEKQRQAERLLAAQRQQVQPTNLDELVAYWLPFFRKELSPNDLAMIVHLKKLHVIGTPLAQLVILALFKQGYVDLKNAAAKFSALFEEIDRPDLAAKALATAKK
jgi:hypothetical protein